MNVILAGGGTAGHINPALAIAQALKNKYKDLKILYIGAKNGMEEKLVPEAGFEFKAIEISGFKRKLDINGIKENLKTIKRVISSEKECKKIMKEFKPDICIGTGGYVSGPVIRTAQKLKIKTVIHEQNAFPGVTTKLLAKKADAVMIAVEDARKFFEGNDKLVLTGNPVRAEIFTADRDKTRRKLGFDDRPVVLSFGGSLGARKVNEAVAELIARSGKDKKYYHIHAYGKYGAWFPDLVKEKGTDISSCDNLDIREYIKDMPDCLAAADLVISRAGAISLSEIQVSGKASVLIPSPNVAENHQFHNAMALANKKAASVIEEKDLTGEKLVEVVDSILSKPEVLKQYSDNARKMAVVNATERILSVIEDVINA